MALGRDGASWWLSHKESPYRTVAQFDSWVGKIAGEGISYPLQDSWASLVA